MPRGFSVNPPWTCRIYQDDVLFATLTISAQDGDPITRKNATKTAILITSLLQEPSNDGCVARLANRLGADAAAALGALADDLGDVFRVVMVSPEGHATAEGYSQRAAALERRIASRLGIRTEMIRQIDPRKLT